MADNTQLVFRMYECFGKGDMDTIRNELFHPEMTWRMPGHHPLSGVMRGVDEVLAFFTALFQAGIVVDNAHFGTLDDGTVIEKHLGHGKIGDEEFLFPTATFPDIPRYRILDCYTAVIFAYSDAVHTEYTRYRSSKRVAPSGISTAVLPTTTVSLFSYK